VNGAFGTDFSMANSINQSSIEDVSKRLLSQGVTSFCPTLISCEPLTYQKILPIFAKYIINQQQTKPSERKVTKAKVLGLHLEGPFFESSKRGAHPLSCILDPIDGITTLENTYGENYLYDSNEIQPGLFGLIRIITLAPELPGALEAIRQITRTYDSKVDLAQSNNTISSKRLKRNSHQIIISCGHSNATLKQGEDATQHGASLITHLFNAMRPFHRKITPTNQNIFCVFLHIFLIWNFSTMEFNFFLLKIESLALWDY